jgi:hypothetical protein
MRPKVAAILADLESHGWQPIIDGAVHRSAAEQAQLVRAGHSHVRFSFHNCSSRTGAPESLAADITDARWGWDSPRKFKLQLAASAESHGLNSGIYFGLRGRAGALRAVIEKRDFEDTQAALGWDFAHVEWRGIPLALAKLGKRPKVI